MKEPKFSTMDNKKINVKALLFFTCSALLFSIVMAHFNTTNAVRKDLGAALILGFFSCLIFFLGCLYMYSKLAEIPVGWAFLGCLLSPLIFLMIHFSINFFHNLDYLYRPDFNETLWVYAMMLYFGSNMICMFVMKPFTDWVRER